jgi:elongation factor 4
MIRALLRVPLPSLPFPTRLRPCFTRSASNVPAASSFDTLSGASNRGHPAGVTKLLQVYPEIAVEDSRIFSIIAHIDHGKSTLADKLLESTDNIFPLRRGEGQVLDNLQVERQRGITVKAQSASLIYTCPTTGKRTLLNLIDTPGHVDFSYEVARSLAACQGALLLIDASQGVQAQTVANYNAAVAAGLKIIPVLTKIDLPGADPEPCLSALETVFGLNPDDALWTSAKTGVGIADVIPAIINRIPAPGTNDLRSKPLRCLLFDSWFDAYRGVVCSVLVVEGILRPGDAVIATHSGDKFTVQEVGLMTPAKVCVGTISEFTKPGMRTSSEAQSCKGALAAGHMGYVILGMKSTKQAQVGDTFVHAANPVPPLPGFRPAKPMVFASLYPVDSGDFSALITAVERLTLNDASVTVERESSSSLGFGLRCGFLGLLHMDVSTSNTCVLYIRDSQSRMYLDGIVLVCIVCVCRYFTHDCNKSFLHPSLSQHPW